MRHLVLRGVNAQIFNKHIFINRNIWSSDFVNPVSRDPAQHMFMQIRVYATKSTEPGASLNVLL